MQEFSRFCSIKEPQLVVIRLSIRLSSEDLTVFGLNIELQRCLFMITVLVSLPIQCEGRAFGAVSIRTTK